MNRKKFLLTSSLCFLGFNLLNSKTLTSSNSFYYKSGNTVNIPLLLKKAANLRNDQLVNGKRVVSNSLPRRSLFTMNLSSSTSNIYAIYDDILTNNPTEIRAYNGKRKTMLQDNVDIGSIVAMYKLADEDNPNVALIKDRLAKEYYRVLTGNKSALRELDHPYNNKEYLLNTIVFNLESAKILDPANLQYIQQLEKIDKLKGVNFFEYDSRSNLEFKASKKASKLQKKEAFEALSANVIKADISRLKSKPASSDRIKLLSKLNKRFIQVLRREKRYIEANAVAVEFYNDNKRDVDRLKLVRMTLTKGKKFDLLESVEYENDRLRNNFWSKVALYDLLLKRKLLENRNNNTQCQTVLNQLKIVSRGGNQKFEFKYREAAFKLYTNSLDGHDVLLALVQSITGIDNKYMNFRIVQLVVFYFKNRNEKDFALLAVNIVLGNVSKYEEDNPLLQQLFINAQYQKSKSLFPSNDLLLLRDGLL